MTTRQQASTKCLVQGDITRLLCAIVAGSAHAERTFEGISFSEADRREMLGALASRRGAYVAARAAQLSGVPERTVYDWAVKGILVPDHGANRPKAWSYRDLVFLRLMAFLRSHRIPLADATDLTNQFRRDFASGQFEGIETRVSAAEGGYSLGDEMHTDALTGQAAFETMVSVVGKFDLLAALDPASPAKRLRGPNLVRPSSHTAISPWVMGGEPVIRNSRISTATLAVLHADRMLSPVDLVALYPSLTVEDVEDAIGLESSLRAAA